MYQIKALCGFEIQVRGDLCTIVDKHNRSIYGGTYDACVEWLKARASWPTPNPRSDITDIYVITTTDGRQDRALRREYATRDEAAEALRGVMGWSDIYLSDSYAVGDGRESAVSAYETQEACDADEEGAYAPRIVLRSAEEQS